MDRVLANLILSHRDQMAHLFKPGQMTIIEKIANDEPMNENEKRYLRGRFGKILNILKMMMSEGSADSGLDLFCRNLNHYYITGLSALKHNGFGWYYDPKQIEIVNTRLEGTMEFSGVKLKMVRLKSLSGRQWEPDDRNGLRYATNEQILKDAKILGDRYLEKTWWTMEERYGAMFSAIPNGFIKRKDL
jgi:hypothetical protein